MRKKAIQNRVFAYVLAFVMIFTSCYVPDAFAANSSNTKSNGNSKSSNANLLTKDNWVKKDKSNQKTDIIVKYKSETKKDTAIKNVKSKLKMGKMKKKRDFKKQKISVYEIGADDDLDKAIDQLNKDPDIEYAQPNYPLKVSAIPTDNKFSKQWGLYNDGQVVNGQSGRANVDLNVMNAWNLTKGDKDVVIGVLDSGIDINHIDLKSSIYLNKDEIAGNGIDDDDNGYIDDVHGYDFINDDANVYDSATTDTHGTNVAGILAATADNGGIVGVAPKVKVLPLKFISGSAGYTSDAIEAIEYAKSMGVKIINCSFGGSDNNQALKEAMKDSGILFVCSAGNSGADTKVKPVYPAAFDIDNIISVAAVDSKGIVPSYSSYGANVDVAAPGSDILCTDPENEYNYYSGTSLSAAYVSGVAALAQSYLPEASIASIKLRIIQSVVPCKALEDKVSSGGRVDAFGALSSTIQAADNYVGKGNDSDALATELDNSDASWYTMDSLASNAERFHYGEGGISPGSGNYSTSCTDMSVPAPGFQVEISRTYNSRNQSQTLLGRGWTFGFEGGITKRDTSVQISLPNGSSLVFNNVKGTYVAEGARGASFVVNVNGVDILTTQDQYKYGFDTTTQELIYMEDKDGNRITLTYESGLLSKITDTVGRDYTLAYNANSLLSSVTDPSGRKVSYEYNANNLLTKVTDPQGGTLSYEYDSSQYLTKLIDQNNHTFQQLVYNHNYGDTENKVAQSTDANGETWHYTYDMKKRTATVTNKAEKTWVYYFDTAMYTIRVQDPEEKSTYTEYAYQDMSTYYGDVKATIDRNGNRTDYEIDDKTGNVTKITKPDGGITVKKYDTWKNVIEETEGKNDTNGNFVTLKRTFYKFTGSKLLLKVQPINGKDDYDYGDSPDMSKFTVTRYVYYTKDEAKVNFNCNVEGLQKSETDPEGNTTTYTYNQYGDTASVTDPTGNTTTDIYDNIGKKLTETTAKGYITKWNYDKNGQVIREIHPDGGVTRTVYDATGYKLLEVNPNQYDSSKDNTTTGAYIGTVGTKYNYYDNGNLSSQIDAMGNHTWYTYDKYGNKQTETRENESSYRYEYDNMDRLTKTYFKDDYSAPEVLLSETSYSILSNGNTQTSVKFYADDITASTTTTIKDYADREVEKWNADGTKEKTVYNTDGTINQKIAANGAITYYTYDAFGNIINILSPITIIDGNTRYTWTRYYYDKIGNITEERKGKNLVTLDNIKTDDYISQAYYSRLYTYSKGLLSQETDSDGKKKDYGYDKDERVCQETKWVSITESQATYMDNNYFGKPNEVGKTVRNGDIEGYEYSNNYINYTDDFYNYDYDGNLASHMDINNNYISYTYDNLDRMIKVDNYKFENGFVLEAASSKTYTWDGKVASETDAKGNTITYTYDARGNQIKIIDALGNVTLKAYDRMGRNTAIVSPKNYKSNVPISELERTEFVYDSMGRVIKQNEIYKKMNRDRSFNWTGEMVSVTTKAYQYDALGNVTSTTDAIGNVSTTDYNLAGLKEIVIDAQTKEDGFDYTVKYTYNGLGQKIKETYPDTDSTYTYDGSGNLLTTSIDGVTKQTISYDLLGRAISIKDGLGNVTFQKWNAFGKLSKVTTPEDTTIQSNTTIYQYDLLGNLTYTKDSLGAVTTYTYDIFGRNLSKRVSNGSGDESITTSTTYDKNGNVLTETDGKGNATAYSYDKLNQKVTMTNALGQITVYTYDANGKLTCEQNQFGSSTQNVYDGINRLIEVRKNLGITGYIVYLYEKVLGRKPSAGEVETCVKLYNSGELTCAMLASLFFNSQEFTNKNYTNEEFVKMLYHVLLNRTEDEGGYNYYLYVCNVASRADVVNAFVTSPEYATKVSTYSLNQYTTIQQNLYNDADTQISSFDALGNETKFLYDKNLRQIGTIDAKGNTSSKAYDVRGNISSETDGNGNITNFEYDGENRLTYVTDALGNATSYTYDSNGNVLTQTDGNGNATTYKYNVTNKLISKTDPTDNGKVGLAETYTYYPNGLMAAKTDRNGVVTNYNYDIFGRLTSENAGGKLQSYTYDKNGNMLTMTDPSGTTTSTYDVLNRYMTKTVPGIGTSTYEYDLTTGTAGEYMEQTTDPKGNITKKTYDKMDRLIKVTAGDETTSYDYYKNGRQFHVVYPNQTTETYSYDADNQVTKLINAKSDGTVLSSYQYTYDAAGNQTSKIDAKGTTTYAYDSLNRLSSVAEPIVVNMISTSKVTSYTFDGAGNRKSEKVEVGDTYMMTLYSYSALNRLTKTLSSAGDETDYIYDNNGNLINKTAGTSILKTLDDASQTGTEGELPNFDLIIRRNSDNGTGTKSLTQYNYDSFNQLTKMVDEDTTAEYKYNADGYRVEKTVNGQTTDYLYEGDKVVLETDKGNNQKAVQVYGNNLLSRSVSADSETSAGKYYYLYNAHGDVTSLINSGGSVAVAYDYDAFGNILSQTGSANNSTLYAGYQHDDESGLYYLNARYYDSVTARFISEDTYTGEKNDPLSLNLYTYCMDNPITYTDPSGHAVYKNGSSGTQVGYIQTVLSGLGYDVDVDGKYGPQTAAAIRQYQEDNGLKVDGIVGPQTLSNIDADAQATGVANNYINNQQNQIISDPKYGNKLSQLQDQKEKNDKKKKTKTSKKKTSNIVPNNKYTYSVRSSSPIKNTTYEIIVNNKPVNVGIKYGYRYVSEAEYQIIMKTGRIPNVGADGVPKEVYVSTNEYDYSVDAENALQIGAQNPNGPSDTPVYRVKFELDSVEYDYMGDVEGGTGIELTTKESIVVDTDNITKLDYSSSDDSGSDDSDSNGESTDSDSISSDSPNNKGPIYMMPIIHPGMPNIDFNFNFNIRIPIAGF